MLSNELTMGETVASPAGVERRQAAKSLDEHFAPVGLGIEPRWTRGTKLAVGTAYSTSSRVWYTIDPG